MSYYWQLTTENLLGLYGKTRLALKVDDTRPAGREVYGVRDEPAFREMTGFIEQVLDSRGARYRRIAW